MRILMVASEALPFAKTGGLADVVGALPRALVRLGHEVDVMIPRYRGAPAGAPLVTLGVPMGASVTAPLSAVTSDGVRTLLVDNPAYFDRDGLYGADGQDYPDNPERFAFLAWTAVSWIADQAAQAAAYDVVHGHDWQTGLVPVLLRRHSLPALRATPTVFTIHNLAYQGVFDASWVPRLGLDPALVGVDGLEFWGRVSFLKGGVMFSRLITTVSPQYAREIQTPELGFGFDGILAGRSEDLVGILNGIDYDQWDPLRDRNLPEPFDATNLKGKTAAKRALLARYGLAATGAAMARPVVGMVSRMVDQKGFDLLAALRDELPALGATFVVLGTGERRYEEYWKGLASQYPDRIGVQVGFDESLAHLIEGGADLFLMPSQFEPCGLNQMYSLRYGTVPVVRATGGLRDTVRPVDPVTGDGTGFRFEAYTPGALLDTLRSALGCYADTARWQRIQRAGMQQDFSWDASARQYVTVYERARVRN